MKTKAMVISLLFVINLACFPQLSFSKVNATPAEAPEVSANLPKAEKIEPAPGISVNQLKEREKTMNDIVAMKQDSVDAPVYIEKPIPIEQRDMDPMRFLVPGGKSPLDDIDLGLVGPPDVSRPNPGTGKIIDSPRIPTDTITPPGQQITPPSTPPSPPPPYHIYDWRNYHNPQMKYEQSFIPYKALSRASVLWNDMAPQNNSYRFFGAAFTMSATTTTTTAIGEEKDEDSIYFSIL